MFTLVYCKTLLCQSSLYKFIARYFSFVHLWNIFSERIDANLCTVMDRVKIMNLIGET